MEHFILKHRRWDKYIVLIATDLAVAGPGRTEMFVYFLQLENMQLDNERMTEFNKNYKPVVPLNL